MTVEIKSTSDSLGLISINGGVRFVVRGYLNTPEYVFWWNIPTGQLSNQFYGKDFIAALNAIKNGVGGSATVPYVFPGVDPADDYYTGSNFVIYGERLAAIAALTRVCTLAQNQNAVNITTPVLSASSLSLIYAQNILPTRIIGFNDAARDENNAICGFASGVYTLPKTFNKE